MRALVTGCAGFIGSHVTESLLHDRHQVVGIDCFNDNYGRAQKLENLARARDWDAFDFVPVDLSRGDLDDLVDGCDVVFHLAAEPGVRWSWGARFESYLRNNVAATQQLLEAVSNVPGCRLVYASSSSVYGQSDRFPTQESAPTLPFSPYGVTKLAGEALCLAYRENLGLDVVALRYFSVYGPRQRPDMAFTIFGRRLLDGEPIELYGGGQTRDFTYVGDVVRATRAAAERGDASGRVLNVGGGSRISLEDAVATLGRVAGVRPHVVRAPARHGDVHDTGADIAAAREALGYRPQVSIAEGLQAQWDWLRSSACAASQAA